MKQSFLYNYFKSKQKGQALVECAIIIPVITMIIFGIVWFSRVMITRQQLVTAARYGTDLILYTNLNENEIQQEIRNYLSHRWINGRKLDSEKLPDRNINVHIDKFSLPDFTIGDYFLPLNFALKMKKSAEKLFNPLKYTSYVEIRYEFDLPKIFAKIDNRTIFVSGRSEVIAGTGCPGDIHN